MRKFCYVEPGGERGEIYETIIKTEDEIIEEYWNSFKERLERMYGKDHEIITKENCIEDWCETHWAWEDKKESGS